MADLISIDAALVRRLVAAQFPAWAELPIRPVSAGGWDNRTFRLGDDKSVRLPSAASCSASTPAEAPLPAPTTSSSAARSRHTTMKHSAPSPA
jgi:aminoglycoside phosphotransferase (APT) family kinase protein